MFSFDVDVKITDKKTNVERIETFVVLANDEEQLHARLVNREIVKIGRKIKVNDNWQFAHQLKDQV